MTEADVIARAKSFIGVTEIPPHLNRGPEIDGWLTRVGSPLASPWCCAFAWCMGDDVFAGAWPVIRSGGCQAVFVWATRYRVIHQTPEAGDLFLLYHASLKRYAHTGYVSSVAANEISTIEGNTNPAGGREGYGVFARTRALAPELAYVRWESLLH